ncbi:class I SAM-dependent methyltransferase [Leptospira sp. 2 VSF19]|uniref:Class I SAM-dependent methyltransferase n=1 Tax=Leptospira soteropolitanensis TaxID=2950025 RepID=A0AAW5VCK8_9LEPT|nr:class I SAM-dependent methyltransferase [Leptospira soteropolitanensis]MCW7493050.1 class I SAM-dependent methyltransferase [Leptospira soteropolitanensis]MCW7500880.1 class I SAM-dependent methyltransferase [Leptospira soteropolitanensis]MCW7522901.1 class I SAM-dependent methyltransferase [Leptospira soteropolitanensis]MCW7526993.1 class I SAM-dependent methyltransferase [Leptospira soteropolitanensis]MCW7530619.1 class I SAM-dependent methyltransferase [Leptospira soteropolitanensis]
MSLFQFLPHKKFPEFYEECRLTGVLRYLPAKQREYGDSYFMEEYKSQYKKSYYEDEPNLRLMAKRRLQHLETVGAKPKESSLLEIGSAAGFFLDEARTCGYQTKGLELSPKEVEFAKSSLGLDVDQTSVLSVAEGDWKDSFDLIAAFFVIEHIEDIEGIWKRMKAWTRPGGYLYLAVPSSFGPSFRTNPKEWFSTHPSDHFFDYSVHSLKKLLSILGFEVNYVRPMSYHSYRDLGLRGKLPEWLYRLYANQFAYGDTIELIARKRKH